MPLKAWSSCENPVIDRPAHVPADTPRGVPQPSESPRARLCLFCPHRLFVRRSREGRGPPTPALARVRPSFATAIHGGSAGSPPFHHAGESPNRRRFLVMAAHGGTRTSLRPYSFANPASAAAVKSTTARCAPAWRPAPRRPRRDSRAAEDLCAVMANDRRSTGPPANSPGNAQADREQPRPLLATRRSDASRPTVGRPKPTDRPEMVGRAASSRPRPRSGSREECRSPDF